MPALTRIQRGTPFKRAVTSDLLNALIDRYNGVDTYRTGDGTSHPPVIVRCANATGTSLDAGAAVSLTYATPNRERIPGLTPPICKALDADQEGVHAILLDPVPNGMEGRAAVSGAVLATVSITDTSHIFAKFTSGYAMVSCSEEEAEASIIVPAGSGSTVTTGTKLCLVHLWGLDTAVLGNLRYKLNFKVNFTSSGWKCNGGYVIWPEDYYWVSPITGTGAKCIYLSLTASSGSLATANSMPNPTFSNGTLTLPVAQITAQGGRLVLHHYRVGDVVLGDTPSQWVAGYQEGQKMARTIDENGFELYLPIEDCDEEEESEE